MTMRTCLAQIALSDNIADNTAVHIRHIQQHSTDLIVFPECSLTGYDLGRLGKFKEARNDKTLRNAIDVIHNTVIKKDSAAVIGTPLLDKGRLFNCSCFLNPDGSRTWYKKQCLTQEENSLFVAGDVPGIYTIRDCHIGVLVCRDQSHEELFKELRERLCSAIIIQSAHFYEPAEAEWKKHRNIAIPVVRAYDFGIPVLKVNAAGWCRGRISLGGTMAVDAKGEVLGKLGEHMEDVLCVEIP